MSVYKIKKVDIEEATSDEIIFTRIMDMVQEIVNDRIKEELQDPHTTINKKFIATIRQLIRGEAEGFNTLVDLFGEREYDDDMDE